MLKVIFIFSVALFFIRVQLRYNKSRTNIWGKNKNGKEKSKVYV